MLCIVDDGDVCVFVFVLVCFCLCVSGVFILRLCVSVCASCIRFVHMCYVARVSVCVVIVFVFYVYVSAFVVFEMCLIELSTVVGFFGLFFFVYGCTC